MNSNVSPEPRNCWIWWTCCTALFVGLAMGWRTILSHNERLPVPTTIAEFKREDLKLDHPLPADAQSANPPGSLRYWIYSGRKLAGRPLTIVAQPPAFDLYTPWLKALIDEKLPRASHECSIKMRGWIIFSSPRTIIHLKSENGYRIRFRNALGAERSLEHWAEDWTEDSIFGAVVEPGRYEIEIDYFSAGPGRYFEIWGSPQVEFAPAPAV
jgi:hypothetical protein